ncbi:MAG: GTPase HflX, partial [Candidatus Marinimicrobia bacterium]|nr:GTPase HflX [Candidatus Neomarinimicrobiota bacterium]
QMGGIGTTGGPGEKQIEIDRRLIRNQISKLKKDLEKIERQRDTQSENRKSAFNISLVGYTNAGKSTLMNALTNDDVYVEDQLFATLDTTTRKMIFDSQKNTNILLSDTVGLIRKLPHDLVASFRSTLSEVSKADFILKVLDASSPTIKDHLETIDSVLISLNSDQIPSQIVLNKVDMIQEPGLINGLKKRFPKAILISARKHLKLDQLQGCISNEFHKKLKKYTFHLAYSQCGILDKIYSSFEVLSREDNEENISITVFGREAIINSILAKL